MSTRLSVNLNDETAVALRRWAELEGRTVTEMIRRSVSVYNLVAEAREKGDTLQIVDEKRRVTVVTWL